MWTQWVNAILGVWVVALAFIGLTGMALMWTLAVTGIVVAVLGVWGALRKSSASYSVSESPYRQQAYQ